MPVDTNGFEIVDTPTDHNGFEIVQPTPPASPRGSFISQMGEGMAGIDLPPGLSTAMAEQRQQPGYGNEPLVNILRPQPGYEEKIQATGSPEEKRLLGYQKGVAETINSLTSPNNLELMMATAGAGTAIKVLPKIIGLAFAAHMGKQVAKDIPEELAKEYAKPEAERDQTRIGQLISSGVAQAGLAATIGAETLKPTAKGVPTDALHREAAPILQPLQE